MTALVLKLIGGCLLVLCGAGIGWMKACRNQSLYRQIEAFVRFLQYIRESIHFRTLPGAVVLAMAARHSDFLPFCGGAATFSQIRPPASLCALLSSEFPAAFAALETSPRQAACDTLDHLTELCRRAGDDAEESARRALRLYPRLGACLGFLLFILLA